MKNSAATIRHIDTAPSAIDASGTDTVAAAPEVEQLSLLTVPLDTRAHQLPTTATTPRSVHARFRLSQQTRERGLQHVAEIRRQLDAAKTARESESAKRMPRRGSAAA